MNLLFVADGSIHEPSSGTEQVLHHQALGLAAASHHVFVLARVAEDISSGERSLGAVREVAIYAPVQRPMAFMERLVLHAPNALHRLIGNHRIDAVIVHQPSLLITLKALRYLRGIPIIYVFHSPWHKEYLLKHSGSSFFRAAGAWSRRLAEALALRMACRIVVLSDYMRDQIRQVHGAPAKKTVVIPGGVDLERFQPVTDRLALQMRLGMPPRRRHLLTVRNLEARMGLDQLLIAFATLKRRHGDLHLTIGGGGPMQRELEALDSKLALGNSVTFTGFIPARLLPQYYAAADLFVMPTRSLEGFGLVTVEALACGTPVLGTPVGGTREILSGLGENHLFKDNSSAAIATGIDRFLSVYEPGSNAYVALRDECRRYAVARYGWKQHQDRLHGLIQSKKKKVTHIITRMDMGGSAQNTLQTCIGLARKYNTILAYGSTHESGMSLAERKQVDKQLKEAKARGVRCVIISSLIRTINPIADMSAFISMYRLLKKEKPDIVHTHTSKAGLLGRWAAKLACVPHIVHTPHGHVFYGHFSDLLSSTFQVIEKVTSPITGRIIALTNGERQDYIRLSIAKAKQLEKIHSGVDVQRFMINTQSDIVEETNDRLGTYEGALVIGTVGWLLPVKGPMHLFNAMKSVWQTFPNVNLVYVGQGEEGTKIRHEAERSGHGDRIHFLGWRDDIEKILPLLNIFVLPSLNEGMGRVIVEAMAAGLPVVASDTGGIPDLVVHGETGLLVSPGDETALADSIIELIENPELAKKMGDAGRARCHRFSLQSMLDKLDRLYQEVLTTEITDNTEI